MLKKAASIVLASLRGVNVRRETHTTSLRSCGLAGQPPWRARVGRVRSLAYLSILLMATDLASLVAQGGSVVYTLFAFTLHHHPSF